MIILRKIIKLVIALAILTLVIIGLRYLIHGGHETGEGFWSFIKWFVLNR